MSFAFDVRVYWEDTDAGGIVFYANYLKFMERARTEWLRSLGIAQHALRESAGGMFVVSETQLKYHRPTRLDDELRVTAELRQIGSASLIIGQRVLLKPAPGPDRKPEAPSDPPLLVCEGTIRIGWVHDTSLRPARMPRDVAATLERYRSAMSHTVTP